MKNLFEEIEKAPCKRGKMCWTSLKQHLKEKSSHCILHFGLSAYAEYLEEHNSEKAQLCLASGKPQEMSPLSTVKKSCSQAKNEGILQDGIKQALDFLPVDFRPLDIFENRPAEALELIGRKKITNDMPLRGKNQIHFFV